MSIPGFCIHRPVTTMMLMLFVVLFGVISLMGLPQELFPPITYPQLTVVTVYGNAAPEEIETLIAKPIEEAVGTVAGIKRIRSLSREGLCLVIAEFGWNEDMDFASLKLREKIDLIKERLPRESSEPLVMKHNPFERPVLTLSVTGKRSPLALRDLTRRVIKEELEKVEGVASATISGGLEREILVDMDQSKLFAREVPLMDVVNAITNANLNYPAGTIKESFYEYLIRTLGEFEHVKEIETIPVKNFKDDQGEPQYRALEADQRKISPAGRLVFIKDVANVFDSYKERTSFSRYNGKENLSISVQKQAQSNILQVVTRVKRTLAQLKKDLPPDIDIIIINDQSKFIESAINNIKDNGWQGAILVFIVLYIFLRNFWVSAVVIFVLPVSLMGVFICMYFNNISINIMSLGGLALGVGMLLDNAIVILENISRHRELGEPLIQASENGASEVTGALFASTMTQCAVFFPMIFVVGIAGQLFKQIAFTIVAAQLVSYIVALTLVPLLITQIKNLKMVNTEEDTYSNKPYLKIFERWVRLFVEHRGKGYLVMGILFALTIFGYSKIDKELMPKADQGQFMVKVNMPSGTKLEITNAEVYKIEQYILGLPDIKDVSVLVGSTIGKGSEEVLQRLGTHQGEIAVTLLPKRKIETRDLVQQISAKIKTFDLRGGQVDYVLSETSFSDAMEKSAPVVIAIKGKKLEEMFDLVNKVKKMVSEVEGAYNIKTDMPERAPETRIIVDKDKAALYQLSVVDIAQMTQVALKGYIASEYKEKGEEVDIRVRLREQDRNEFNKLANIELISPAGAKVPLTSLVSFVQGRGPSEIKRVDQERTILVTANLFKRGLKDVMHDVQAGLKRLQVPSDCAIKIAGETEEMKESFNSLMSALILSIVLVYMIMAAQFESFMQPFIIMFTIPLSLIGVVLALIVSHTSLNVIVLLGVILLAGVAVNNGIVLIDYVNLLLSRGAKVSEAIVEASKTRLRPILMSALSAILGWVPMAFATGEGAELSAPLAIAVMGGLLITTFLSLFVIPAVYLSFNRMLTKILKRKE